MSFGGAGGFDVFYIWTEPVQLFPPVSRDVMVASIFSSNSLQENTIIVFPKCQTVPLSGFYFKCRFNLDQNTTNTGNE